MINPAILKMLIRSIGIENISNSADSIIQEGIKWIDSQPLQPGEVQIVGILYHNAGIPYYAVVAMDQYSTIVRYIQDKPLKEFIESFISNLK